MNSSIIKPQRMLQNGLVRKTESLTGVVVILVNHELFLLNLFFPVIIVI